MDIHQYVSGIYGQINYGRIKRQTNYAAFASGLWGLLDWCEINGVDSIGIPYGIGCGLAGGDWDTVFMLIKECQSVKDVDIRIYKKED